MLRSRALFSVGATALLLGAGCSTSGSGDPAAASDAAGARSPSRIDKLVNKAEVAIAEHRGWAAVKHAEQLVALSPSDPAHRALLAHAYLQAGRFASAAQAAGDALALDPREPRAALDLALAQTALGDWTAARATLATYAEVLRPADRGLALALAGDPIGGAVLIGEEARGAAASATARQNLALALALGGRWAEARAVAAVDLTGDELERRMREWMAFVQPTTSSQQVATLLGTEAVADPGQPLALALVRPAAAAPVAVAQAPAPVEVEQAAATPASGVRFAPRQEIVQPIAARVAVSQEAPRPIEAAAPARGRYYVQLGAHEDAAVAQDAWETARRRYRALAGLTPSGVEARVGEDRFYRLSVGGFARSEAVALCERLRAQGGRCFVRAEAGDRVAAWAARERQVAAR
nr:SPOR domain-containing protein [Sphingomonas sp. ACRSK]